MEDPNDIKDYNKPYRVCFYNDDISFSYNRPFNRIKGDKGYYVDITIPMEWSGYYFISLKTDCAKIVSNHRRQHILGPNSNEVRITKDETDPLTLRDKITKSTKSLLQTLIYLLILAVVAFGAVWINNKFFQNGKVNGNEAEVEHVEEFSGNAYADELTPQINAHLSKLQDEAVSFDEIRNIKLWIDQNLSKLDNNNGGIQLKDKVDAYMSLISVVETNANRKVDKIKGTATNVKNLIEPIISNVWITVNSDGSKRNILDPERTKVDAVLKEGVHYKSFRDIPSSFDIINIPSNNASANNGANRNNGNRNRQQDNNSSSNNGGDGWRD